MLYPASELVIDPVLLRKYGLRGRRPASYPTAERFVEAFGERELRHWLARRNIGGFSQPLSLCVHLPRHDAGQGRSAKYIKYLEKESALLAPLLPERPVRELQLRGEGCIAQAMPVLQAAFGRIEKGVASIALHDLASTERAIGEARDCGLRSVSLELGYGAPRQTLDGFNRTLDAVLRLAPERVALRDEGEPTSGERSLELLTLALGRLARAGYSHIGMDRFARDGAEGYAAAGGDVLALGPAALGQVGPCCYQNLKRADAWRAALDAGRLPVLRGLELGPDDLVRRAVIQALMCHFRVSIESIELAYLVDFHKYFAGEWQDLRALVADGVVELEPDWIAVTPRGRLVAHAAAALFDRHAREARARDSVSRVL